MRRSSPRATESRRKRGDHRDDQEVSGYSHPPNTKRPEKVPLKVSEIEGPIMIIIFLGIGNASTRGEGPLPSSMVPEE
jgi:hypothetical protein